MEVEQAVDGCSGPVVKAERTEPVNLIGPALGVTL